MDVLINSECNVIPENAKKLTSEGNVLLNFLRALNYDPLNPPYADLLKQYHQLEGNWLVLSPIHWEATHNDALIVAHSKDLELKESEAISWFQLISKYFEEDGKIFYYHNAETWLMSDDKKHILNSKPVHHLLNCSLMPTLNQMDESMYWQKFFTECQMLLASKPNHSLLNGLWVWGGAQLKDKLNKPIRADHTFHPIATICSSNVTLYSPEITLKDFDILLVNELSILSDQHRKQLEETSVSWYWNNTAYIMPSRSKLIRLWRKIIHAH